MNVLFVVPYVPNLIRVRPYNLLRALAARGHRITLLTVWASQAEQEDLKALEIYCDAIHAVHMPTWRSLMNCLKVLPRSSAPLQSVYSWAPDFAAEVGDLSRFDVIHVEHLRGSRYGLYFKTHNRVPVVWDSVDCISYLFRQASQKSRNKARGLITRFELGRTERYEAYLTHQFDHILVTSAKDREALLGLASKATANPSDIAVLPNGVDLAYFEPDESVERYPATLVVSGKMSYHANGAMVLYLAQQIMPRVWAERPDVQLLIVGKDPPAEILALERNPAVMVTGQVPDIRPYLQRATLAVAPILYGAGIQNKVLEAMACATPVIATPLAVSALATLPDRDLMVAADADSFAITILNLLDDPAKRRALGLAGRAYVQANHNWETIGAHLEEVYHGVICQNNGRPVRAIN